MAERWPKWFNMSGDLRHTLMPFGFEHGDGWFDILVDLCEELEPLVEAATYSISPFEVMQVKEKFGGLRFYTSWGNKEIWAAIDKAEKRSLETCEVCGKPGRPEGPGWIKTLCPECREGRWDKRRKEITSEE